MSIKFIIAIMLVCFPVFSFAADQNLEVNHLQCEGTYDKFTTKDIRGIPITGIYLEVSNSYVKILGAAAFDGLYSVVTNREDGIGITLESNTFYGGFLNRLNGNLSLMEKSNIAKDGSFKINQLLKALCQEAKPLF